MQGVGQRQEGGRDRSLLGSHGVCILAMNISELLQGFDFAWFWLEEEKFFWSCSHRVLQSFWDALGAEAADAVEFESDESVQGQFGWTLSNLVQWKDVPAHARGLEQCGLSGFSQPKPFCSSLMPLLAPSHN